MCLDHPNLPKQKGKMSVQWRKLQVQGANDEVVRPYGFSSANLVGPKIFVYGGTTGALRRNTLYVFDIPSCTWKVVNPCAGERFFVRTMHSSVLVEDKLLIFGGLDKYSYSNDLVELDLVLRSSRILSFKGAIPKATAGHSCCYLPRRNSFWMYTSRGVAGGRSRGTLVACNLPARKWQVLDAKGKEPSSRWKCGSTLYSGYWFLYGGERVGDFVDITNDLFVIDTHPSVPVWSQIKTVPELPRSIGLAAMLDKTLFLFKADSPLQENALTAYDLEAKTTSGFYREGGTPSLNFPNAVLGEFPPIRIGGMVVANQERIFVFGGHRVNLADVYVLEPAKPQ